MFELKNAENRIVKELEALRAEKKKIVLYGCGYCGHEAMTLLTNNSIEVAAVCDDFRVGNDLDGRIITAIEDIHPDDETVIFITSGFNEKMKRKLNELGMIRYYRELDFGRYDVEKENYLWFKKHFDDITRAYELLEDDRSRMWMEVLINYKISRDLSLFPNDGYDRPQYFPMEDNLDLRSYKECFLDLGAYDGDTCIGFSKYTNGLYGRMVAVEASPVNCSKLKENLSGYRNISVHNVGVYKKKSQIRFVMNEAKNSFASVEGTVLVDVDTVDHIMQDNKVSFIKMDIEGAEYDALLGAKETIKRDTPVLAVSIYHKTEDIYRLQLLIEDMHPNYKYYIRHYSPTAIETILYAVPK